MLNELDGLNNNDARGKCWIALENWLFEGHSEFHHILTYFSTQIAHTIIRSVITCVCVDVDEFTEELCSPLYTPQTKAKTKTKKNIFTENTIIRPLRFDS